jgi:ABC-type uncharacterized transport system auxiliary subunit
MRRLTVVALFAASALLAGCGGGSVATTPVVAANTGQTTLLRVPSLTVAAGSTMTLMTSTAIVSSGPVEIDGTITVPAGATFAIDAPSIVLSGAIQVAPATPAGTARTASGRRNQMADPQPSSQNVLVSDNIVVRDTGSYYGHDEEQFGGGNIAMVAQSVSGTVTIAGYVRGLRGANATLFAPPGAVGGAQLQISKLERKQRLTKPALHSPPACWSPYTNPHRSRFPAA